MLFINAIPIIPQPHPKSKTLKFFFISKIEVSKLSCDVKFGLKIFSSTRIDFIDI
jgi:hypothetical protein